MIPGGLRKVWRALSGSVPLVPLVDAYDRFGFFQRLGREEWSPALRTEVLRALEPCVEVRQAWSSLVESLGEASEEAKMSVAAVLSFDCELEAGQALQMMIEELRGRSDWQAILGDVAFDVSGLLRKALDLHAALDAAGQGHDPSYIEHPSIEPHDQNRDFHGWTLLIELVRESFDALAENDRARARPLVLSWEAVPYPVFRRLSLYAARQSGIVEPAQLIETMKLDPQNWIWSVEIQVELFRTLPWLWSGLDEDHRNALITVLLHGPPREMFRAGISSEDWEGLRAHSIWERLARLRQAGATLDGGAEERLTQIEAAHPGWQLTGADRDDFPTWMETGWGLPTDFSVENLLALDDERLVEILTAHDTNREGMLDSWRGAAQENPARAVRILDRLRQLGQLDAGIWSRGLMALREPGEGEDLRREALVILEELPASLLSDAGVVRAVADAVRALAQGVSDDNRPRLLSIWDAAFPASMRAPGMQTDERVTDAINHPTGVLTEAALIVLRSRELERNAGIDEDVRSRLERVIAAGGEPGQLGRVLVASRLSLLHDLDPEWAKRNVVRLLDWSDPDEARGAWQGFLWSPWVRPSLWEAIKSSFLETFNHLDSLGRVRPSLAGILASICIEGQDAISPLEAAECLRKLDDGGREEVVIWISRKLEGAGEKAPNLWRNQVQPWLESSWPREPELRGPGASTRLAWVATLVGSAFREAAESVARLVGPIERGRLILKSMEEKGLIQAAPAACLQLVAALTPDQPPHWFGDLRSFLDQIRAADPELAETAAFQRLNEIGLRIGM